jgi:hypothetical protein
MSKRNNVNPGQYKVGGREKPGTPLGPEGEDKEAFSQSKKQERARAPEENAAAPKENRKK